MEAIKSIGKHYKVTFAFIVSVIYILLTIRFCKTTIGSITFKKLFNDTMENGTAFKSRYPKVMLATKLLNLENIIFTPILIVCEYIVFGISVKLIFVWKVCA